MIDEAGREPATPKQATAAGPAARDAYAAYARDAYGVRTRTASRRRSAPVHRQTSEDYFEAAFQILAERGSEEVTIASLCDRLGVTKGSFYYHFYNMPEFVEALAQFWEEQVGSAISVQLIDPDPLVQMSGFITTVANLRHEAEAALRAWGHSNPVIESAQRRIDQLAETAVAAIAANFVDDQEAVDLLAHQAVALAIGLQHRPKPIDRMRCLRAMVNLAELAAGVHGAIAEGPEGPVVRFQRAP